MMIYYLYSLYYRADLYHFEHGLSIMVNSVKALSNKAKKGQVTVRLDSGSIKACFPRTHFADEKQVKLATAIPVVKGWETKASQLQRRLQLELEEGKLASSDGKFNIRRYKEILEEYGLRAKLRIVNPASESSDKPELSLLEIWDMYCEYRKHSLAETTYKLKFQGHFRNTIIKVNSLTNSPIEFRQWLIDNVNLESAKSVLQYLSHAFELAISQGFVTKNLFKGLADDIEIRKRTKIISQDLISDDAEVLNKTKAYTWNEALSILKYIQDTPTIRHYYPYVKFKFFTGCRPGEASGLWWTDIKWDDEYISIRRTFNEHLKIFKPTKNETVRLFPMPKGGDLWDLLKSIPEGKPNEVVFKNRQNKIIRPTSFLNSWHGQDRNIGIIPALLDSGKLSKYLPPYNTRHTFINHQINEVGIAPHIVNTWCEHSEEISREHYRQLDLRIVPGYGEVNHQVVKQQSEIELLKEQLKQQQEIINKLLQDRDS